MEKVIKNLEYKQIIHQTIRKFGDSNPIQYISLHLNQISIEAIIWIIISIRNDEMTPNEKMVLSRIKECYGVKINQLYWNGIMLYISNLADINGDVILNNNGIFNLKLKKVKESTQDYYLIYLKDNIEWVHSDNGPILQEDYKLWKIFIEFIKEFFQENDTSQNMVDNNINKQKHKWTSSVENVHTKSTKKALVRPPRSINKAIPGGRYGCAQLLKCCGSLPLRSCSLGKLSLFVQEAISRGILIYYKTLLIKPANLDFDEVLNIDFLVDSNNNNESCQKIESDQKIYQINKKYNINNYNNNNNINNINNNNTNDRLLYEEKLQKEQHFDKINIIKQTITDILMQNKKGVSLARLPKLIQKSIDFPFDLHELGFPKLKSLLQTIQDIIIENDGTTQAQAILKVMYIILCLIFQYLYKNKSINHPKQNNKFSKTKNLTQKKQINNNNINIQQLLQYLHNKNFFSAKMINLYQIVQFQTVIIKKKA
ncbi:hypothetical protein IMG5_183490 [Ichthyophthirius multifiliis]|uniref:HTH OST-type domain-containing protein n=1 Tax=Ichthyophthirius multifiliis TaxID=5932 RepID=G0R369_ICHMU|nr:hypothetical protein IMG5_183490 [Ichthyophthirius multifiliis]EGR28092.1 hypothetical protein IMG5_183490 [Ichthyophthirius multifiliis]|eukprot:XP_004027437.1 hypothetical protein IMG5_183490 [Ichthyophthirius multifiliis]